ncbi:hypothetical protein K439DRAFT_530485 [Ramaria rubella]|nr:hypothetical protein K439DRAFT_530485 [Ramaria rubella]
MPGRHHAPVWKEDLHEKAAEGFSHSRISPTVYTSTSTSCDTPSFYSEQSKKRRRLNTPRPSASNINARFDRMLERINVIPAVVPQGSSSPSSRRRKRGGTTSSLSGSSERAPPTPVDAYDDLEGGRLGDGFKVFKARDRDFQAANKLSKIDHMKTDASHSRSPLPSWLSLTFSTLEPHNPLRKLAPPNLSVEDACLEVDTMYGETSHCGDSQPMEDKPQDCVFAFSPPPIVNHSINEISSPTGTISSPCQFYYTEELEPCNSNRPTDEDFIHLDLSEPPDPASIP